jgi:cytohesin
MESLDGAAGAGDVARIRALVEAGADVNESDESGVTPLFVAAYSGHAEAVAALLEMGADVHRWDSRGEPLMHWAAEEGTPEVIRLLVEAGADVNQRSPRGWTGLHEAALLGRADIAEELLRAGADPNVVESEGGDTPLLLAARHVCFTPDDDPGGAEIVRLLLAHGADATATDAEDKTPLDWLARWGTADLVSLLLAHGATHNLHSAAGADDVDAVRALVAEGADVNATDSYGSTPLHHAVPDLDVVRELLLQGADPNARDSQGDTPLHVWAQLDGAEEVGRALVEAGANADALDNCGETPLFFAARTGKTSCTDVLLRLGADPTVTDSDGWTPAQVARDSGYEDIARMIETGPSQEEPPMTDAGNPGAAAKRVGQLAGILGPYATPGATEDWDAIREKTERAVAEEAVAAAERRRRTDTAQRRGRRNR